MRRSLLFLTCALVLTTAASHCTAGIISFTLGTFPNLPPAEVNVNIDNAGFQTVPATGTATLDLPGHSTTSGTAQITALDFTLTNGLSFSLTSLGGETASTAPGDVSFSLVTPGAAATLTPAIGGGNFDQLGNQLEADGDLTISNSSTFDLGTLTFPPTSDFNLSGVGSATPFGFGPNDLILAGTFLIEQDLDVDGTIIPLVVVGEFVGVGTKPVPEPGSTMILIGIGTVLLTRRRR